MRPIGIKIRDFLGIKEVDYEFKPGVFVVVGRNGSGKSSFFEAVYFALFGKGLRHGGKVKPYIRRGHRLARIEFTFERHGEIYKVIREIYSTGPSKRSLYRLVNGRASLVSSGSEVDRSIKELLGVDQETFEKIFHIPQGRITETIEKIGNIRELVLNITGIENLSDLLKRALDEILDREKLGELAGEKKKLLEIVEGKTEEDLMKGLEDLEREREKLWKDKERISADLEGVRKILELEKKFEELERLKREKDKLLEKAKKEEVAEKLREAFKIREELRELKREVETSRKETARLEGKLGRLLKDKETLEGELNEVEEKLENVSSRLAELKSEREKLGEILRKVSGYLSERISKEADLKRLRRSIGERKKELGKEREILQKFERELQILESSRRELEEELEKAKKEEIEYMAERIASFLNIGDRCPVCGGEFRGRELKGVEGGRLEEVEERIRKIDGRRSALEAKAEATKERIEKLEKDLEELEDEEKEILKTLEDIERKLRKAGYSEDLQERLEGLEEKIKEKEMEMESLRKRESELSLKISKVSSEISKIEGSLKEKRENMERDLKRLEALEKEFERILESAGVREEEIDDYKEYLGGGFKEKLIRIEERISSLERDVEGFERKDLRVYEERAEELRRELERIERRSRELSEMIGERKREIDEFRRAVKRLEVLEKELSEKEEDSRLIDEIKSSLRKDSLGDFVIRTVFKPVVEVAAARVENITSGKFSLRLSGSSISVVDRNGREVDVNSLSGGEKTIVALMLALSISEALSSGIELFFIDEGFSALDEANRESVADMLRNLEEKGKTVMFITHFEDLAEKFENVIRFEDGRITTG